MCKAREKENSWSILVAVEQQQWDEKEIVKLIVHTFFWHTGRQGLEKKKTPANQTNKQPLLLPQRNTQQSAKLKHLCSSTRH